MKIKLVTSVMVALLSLATTSHTFAQSKSVPANSTAQQLLSSIAPAKKDPRITPAYLESLYSDAWFSIGETYWDESKLANWEDWENKFAGKLKTEQDLDSALSQMVGSLHDQWTTYDSSHKRLLQAFASVRGIVNLGPLFKRDADGEYVVTLVPFNSPAHETGLQVGDEIIAVNEKPIRSLTPDQVADLLQAPIGTKVTLSIVEARTHTASTIAIVATPSKRPTAEAKLLPDGILYARHSSFLDGETNGLFNESVATTIEHAGKINGMVLDLRGNPGGQFELVQKELAFFLPGKVIVQSVTREGNLVTTSTIKAAKLAPFEYNMLPERHKMMIDLFTTVPLVVLIDGSTASAAEIMSSALQDNGRAVAVGQSTYRKGVGFKEIDVPLGGELDITNLKYFTPAGLDVSVAGVKPQVEVVQPRDGTDRQLLVGLETLKALIQKAAAAQ
jgi:C-terminal peptidase prc